MSNPEPLIPKHGGYQQLKSYQVAELLYDVTVRFCDRYLDRSSRTHDQMVQAARSGVQNIAEGSQASGTSRKIELKLTGIARASLEELRKDYEAFLRHRGLRKWEREDPRRSDLVARRCASASEVAAWVEETRRKVAGASYAETAANAALVLVSVASGLLWRQMEAQARAFEAEGGFTERLYRVRSQRKRDQA